MTLETSEEISDVWSTGSYAEFAKSYLSMATRLVETTAVASDDDILDVGCGTGNVAITAARRGARVVGLDIKQYARRNSRLNCRRTFLR